MSIEKDTKLKNKFDKAKIYKLIDNTNDNVYIGSTCNSLKTRLSTHKCSYEMFLFHNIKSYEINKNGNYIKSFDIIKNGDYKIELLEDCDINTKHELLERERFYIENNECLNKKIEDINYDQYYNDNKIDHYQKEYCKKKIEKKYKEAKKYREAKKSKHLKTDKHQNK